MFYNIYCRNKKKGVLFLNLELLGWYYYIICIDLKLND